MKCPKCGVDLQTKNDRGVEVEACPKCRGMWLTPAELDELENEAFNDEANKGSLYLVSHETELKCPVCAAPLKRLDYRSARPYKHHRLESTSRLCDYCA